MAYKRKKIDRVRAEFVQQQLVKDGLNLVKEMRGYLDGLEKCLKADSPCFPYYTIDLNKAGNVMHQIAGCHAVLTNILNNR